MVDKKANGEPTMRTQTYLALALRTLGYGTGLAVLVVALQALYLAGR